MRWKREKREASELTIILGPKGEMPPPDYILKDESGG
jgi:hypothetical protein